MKNKFLDASTYFKIRYRMLFILLILLFNTVSFTDFFDSIDIEPFQSENFLLLGTSIVSQTKELIIGFCWCQIKLALLFVILVFQLSLMNQNSKGLFYWLYHLAILSDQATIIRLKTRTQSEINKTLKRLLKLLSRAEYIGIF